MDCGRSIPATIADEAEKTGIPDDDGTRIAFACKKHISSRRWHVNQGAGLYKLVETVKQNGGRLLILSRNGLFHVSGGKSYSRKFRPIDGTMPILAGTLAVVNLRVS